MKQPSAPPETAKANDGKDPNIPSLNAEDPLFGLTAAQVEASRTIFGRNELLVPETPLWKLFLHQFVGFLVRNQSYILIHPRS
jgi:hypothetical protein